MLKNGSGTPNNLLSMNQWMRLGLFLLACFFGVASVLSKRIELALLASVAVGCSFWTLKNNYSNEDVRTNSEKFEINSDRLILSITLFIYAVLFMTGATYLSTNITFSIISLFLWVIFIGLMLAAGIVFDGLRPFAWIKRFKLLTPTLRRNFFIEISMVLIITGIALALRATNLNLYPPMVHGDEGETGMEALRVLGVGESINPLQLGWGPLPNLFHYLQAGSILIFGRNEIGLRMMAALFGTLCVPLVYLIGRKFWGKIAGFTGAWLITVSHFNIHYSRFGFDLVIESAFFMIFFILIFLAANFHQLADQDLEPEDSDGSNSQNQKFKITPYITAGLICGLSQYTYFASRLIPLVAAPLYLYLFFRRRFNIIQIAITGLTAILIIAPLGVYYLQHPNDFSGRMDSVSIFNPENIRHNYGQDATLSNSFFSIIGNQLKKNLDFFLDNGDSSSVYFVEIPGFDFITSILFWLGLGVVCSRARRLPEMALLIWLVFGIVLGGVITNDSPDGTRLLITTLVVYIVGGIFIQQTWNVIIKFYNRIPDIHLSLAWLSAPILVCIMAATLAINMNYYFNVYVNAGVNMGPITMAKEIIADAPTDHVFLFGDGELFVGHGTIRFLAGDGKAKDIRKLDELPKLTEDGKGITVLFTGSHFAEFNSLKSLYPQGILSEIRAAGILHFMKYRIPPLP